MEFINDLIACKFGFADLWAKISEFYATVAGEGTAVKGLWDTGIGFIKPYIGAYFAYILIALSLVQAFFGKRLLGLQKFLGFFAIGFTLGMYYLAPIVKGFLPVIPDWVVGLVVAVLAAVLSKVLYLVVVAVAAGYSAYLVAYSGMVLGAIKGNLIVAAAVAVVAIVLVLLLLKWIEILGTAFGGGYLFALALLPVFDYTTMIPLEANLDKLVVAGVVGLLGFIIQVVTRKRKRR